MEERTCPLDKPVCVASCQWYMDGKCAVFVQAEKLGEIADLMGAFKRETKKAKN